MAWESTRPVPWQRMIKEWCLYAAIMVVIFLVVARENSLGVFLGLLASLPLYLVFGYVLAKFGYTRKTLRELRGASAGARSSSASASASASSTRARPAPTKRTNAGSARGTKRR